MGFLISLKGWGWISYHIFCYSHKDNNKICCFSHDLLNSIQEKEEELLESFFFHQNGTRKLLLAIWFEKLEYLYARMNIPLANWRIDASVMHQRNIHLQYDFCTFGVSNQKSSDLSLDLTIMFTKSVHLKSEFQQWWKTKLFSLSISVFLSALPGNF